MASVTLHQNIILVCVDLKDRREIFSDLLQYLYKNEIFNVYPAGYTHPNGTFVGLFTEADAYRISLWLGQRGVEILPIDHPTLETV